MFYLYILKSLKDGNLYIGTTDNIKRRLREHNNGKSNFTLSEARKREWYFKNHSTGQQLKKKLAFKGM